MSGNGNLALNDRTILDATVAHVRERLVGEGSGHDWWHVYRVWQMALRIGEAEGADLRVVELAALLHDIADWKFHDGDLMAGGRAAHAWLAAQGEPAGSIESVCAIIDGLSFKGAGVATDMPTLEGRVVQDADRLDAIGAIGIARAFAYGGHAGRMLHDPETLPEWHDTPFAYRNARGTTIHHFHEKLLLLKGRMQTPTGRALAEERHAFMESYLEAFLAEWDGRR